MFSKRRSTKSRRKHATRRLMCENLEGRRLLAASVTDGILTIDAKPVGGEISDTVVSERGRQVTVWQNGKPKTFSRNEVQRIVFNGSKMSDRFDNQTNISATVRGKGGNDFLYAGYGNDLICGGAGHDKIFFHRGGGEARGGAGNDIIRGERASGPIIARGGRGNDEIVGGNFDDKLYGGSDQDKISGGSGDDLISGGRGNDRLWDGDGKDTVLGGAGVDRFFMQYGTRDDGDLDMISLGGRAQLKSEAHFAHWFEMDGTLKEKGLRR